MPFKYNFYCSAIVSCNSLGTIGVNNELLYKIPDDLKNFKKLTMGHYVIVGKNTYESIPNRLPGRKILLMTSNNNYKCYIHDDIKIFQNPTNVMDFVENKKENEVFVIGGASVYGQFWKYINRIYMTYIFDDKPGDSYFTIDKPEQWSTAIISTNKFNDLKYEYRIMDRNLV